MQVWGPGGLPVPQPAGGRRREYWGWLQDLRPEGSAGDHVWDHTHAAGHCEDRRHVRLDVW